MATKKVSKEIVVAAPVVIYALRHPETNEIRYIGKAVDHKSRLWGHCSSAKNGKMPVNRWVKKLASSGLKPVMTIEREVPASEWQQAEIDLIAKHRASGVRLLNVTSGGDGASGITLDEKPHEYVLRRLVMRLTLGVRRHKERGESEKAAYLSGAVDSWKTFAASNPDEALSHVMGNDRLRTYCGV